MSGFVLIADFETVRNMGHRFHGKQAQLDYGDLMMAVAIVLALVFAAVILTRLTRRQDREEHYSNPRGLFNELCRAHGLDRNQRRLIRRLAASQGLDQPSRLFLEADRWKASDLPFNLRPLADRYQALYEQLFSVELAPAADAAANESDAPSTVAVTPEPVMGDLRKTGPLSIPLPSLTQMPGFGSESGVLGG